PGRFDEARSFFTAFARHISQGMIPNRFPDYGEQPDYNTVDATLWFFVALERYLAYTGDYDFVETELWSALEDILVWHRRGTRCGIHVAEDGLLWAGDEGTQLTWMDAKVGDWVVTPRHGKPVEINALWYNALRFAETLAARFGEAELEAHFQKDATRVVEAFGRTFWNPDQDCLYDVVNAQYADGSIRPNQILAVSLPHPLLQGDQARQVFDTVDRHLFTPYGLRSLSPSDQAYRGRYEGGQWDRDGAYHQGTVWAWLMGPFISALVRVYGEAGRKRARRIVAGFESHLHEAGLGTVSEIFDAEPPYAARGCIAQAWSVAELVRAWYEDVLGQGPGQG
ncbi:MAG: amylo-alpha-1,6-glucosidase, partial [Candidatus Latescibacterota bacterium]